MNWIENTAQDLRFALRGCAKTPGFAVAAVATLALGIGANTAVFSVVSGVLLRPLPYADPDRIVQLNETQPRSGFSVETVDSTGAGDTFNAALAVFLHEGLPIAVRKACAAAALSVTRLGARGGMPHPAEVDALLARQHA